MVLTNWNDIVNSGAKGTLLAAQPENLYRIHLIYSFNWQHKLLKMLQLVWCLLLITFAFPQGVSKGTCQTWPFSSPARKPELRSS